MHPYLSHGKWFWRLQRRYGPVKTSELDYVVRSSLCLYKSHTECSNIQCASTQTTTDQYYQPQWVTSMAWTVLVTWCTHRKLAPTKIWQNLKFILVISIVVLNSDRCEDDNRTFCCILTWPDYCVRRFDGLGFLFNGMLTFVIYLMPKPSW